MPELEKEVEMRKLICVEIGQKLGTGKKFGVREQNRGVE